MKLRREGLHIIRRKIGKKTQSIRDYYDINMKRKVEKPFGKFGYLLTL